MAYRVELLSLAPDETRKLAGTVAAALRPGDVVGLTGELGAGKTLFVQAAAAALGVSERVTSPSFVLRRDYPGRIPVTHLDVYRLDSLAQVTELGYDEIGDPSSVTFIEWSDAMAPLLPPERLEAEFRLPPATAAAATDLAEPRRIVLSSYGPLWRRRLEALSVDLQPWQHQAGD